MSENAVDKVCQAPKGQKSDNELWKQIGFVRPLGGLLYNIILVVGTALIGMAFSVWLLPNYIYPFPSAMGWESMTKSLFGFYFVIADVGLGTAIQRFIGEQNIKNPRKSIKYLQFFIYFQMFTGLIQITIVAIWVFAANSTGDLNYASWFFLLYSLIQWPGMLGVFHGALQSYQRFDKANIISFFQGVILENSTRILFILIGRYIGRANPEIGELMGATMGAIIGAYVDDFLAAFLAALWLKPILLEIDPEWKLGRIFRVEFDMDLVKECSWYGFKIMLQGVIFPGANLLSVFILTKYLPNYPTIWGIYLIADLIAAFIGSFSFNLTAPFSEAINNKKYKLASDYLVRSYRWATFFGGMFIGLLFFTAPIMGDIAGVKFQAAVPLIQVFIIFKVMEIIIQVHDKVFRGGGKPEYNILVMIIEQSARLAFLYVFLVVIPLSGMAIVLSRGLGWVVKWFVSYFIIQKKMVKFKINLWQTIIAPFTATIAEALFAWLLVALVYNNLIFFMSTIIAAVITLGLALGVGPLFVWLPIYTYMGGWDTHSLEIFHKAALISGPSKKIALLIYKIAVNISQKSKLHNRFPIQCEEANLEIQELAEFRKNQIIARP